MLTLTTTSVGIFMYKCGLCPACVGKRLIVWRQHAIKRLAHTKRSHIIIALIVFMLCVLYAWTMYPQFFYIVRYHAWNPSHRTLSRQFPNTRRNLSFPELCGPECVPDVDAMTSSRYDVPYSRVTDEALTIVTSYRHHGGSGEAILREFLTHYSKMRRVQRLVLVWSGNTAPSQDYDKTLDLGVPLHVVKSNSTTLRSTFQALRDIRTEAVMLIDDDVILSRDEVYHAFGVWQVHPWSIVGYYGGAHAPSGNSGLYRHSMVPYDYYSMVQQGALIVHREYARMFVDRFTAGVARYGCDDMALNFLVSDHCRCAAAYYVIPKSLYIRVTDKLELLSAKWQYRAENDACLNYYTSVFHGMPLKSKTCFW